MLLALDTSTRHASLALTDGDTLQAEFTWMVGNNHSVELLRRLEWLLHEQHMEMSQLHAVAAAIGPGSFTGVRVAVTVSKTLSFSLKVPLIGVSTLDLIAYSQATAGLPVCALLDAGRGEVYIGRYQASLLEQGAAAIAQRGAGVLWQRQGEYQVLGLGELAGQIRQPTLFCGEISSQIQQTLAEQLGALAVFVPRLASTRRAGLLAELATQRLARGEQDDPLTLEPLYLRRPAITVSAKPRAQMPTQAEAVSQEPEKV
ncbi:MAG TPA: tRNA (adenosine(37)-N6)-threonylcarbamoyltransferase complex dimerization subunit type 1 TsaB [Ktedonobacterales bacterium]